MTATATLVRRDQTTPVCVLPVCLTLIWTVIVGLSVNSVLVNLCVASYKRTDAEYRCRLGNEGLTMSENVRDLGVVVDSHSCFIEHIANITRKAHQRANLIHRCFSSMAETATCCLKLSKFMFASGHGVMKNILLIESVQRKFTQIIPGMSDLNYYSRLRMLGLKTLELRRLRTDVLLVYRICVFVRFITKQL